MKVLFFFLLVSNVLLLSSCSNHRDNEPPQQATSAHVIPELKMSIPASNLCDNSGGTLALTRQLDGTSVTVCQLVNGRRCDESALLSGGCRH